MWVSCPSVTIPGKPRLKPTTTTLSWSYFEIRASVYTFMGCRGHNSAHNKSLSWAISRPDPCNPNLQFIFQMLFRSSFLGVAAVKFTGGGMLDSPAKSSERKIFQAFPLPSWHELTGYSHKHLGGSSLAPLTPFFPMCDGPGRALWLEGPEIEFSTGLQLCTVATVVIPRSLETSICQLLICLLRCYKRVTDPEFLNTLYAAYLLVSYIIVNIVLVPDYGTFIKTKTLTWVQTIS